MISDMLIPSYVLSYSFPERVTRRLELTLTRVQIKESYQGMFGLDINSTQPTRQMVADKYEEMSEQFFDQMQPITAEKPW